MDAISNLGSHCEAVHHRGAEMTDRSHLVAYLSGDAGGQTLEVGLVGPGEIHRG